MKMTDFEFQIENLMLYCTSKNLSTKSMKSYEQTLKLLALYLKEHFSIDEVEKVQQGHIRHYIAYLKERGKYTVLSDEQTQTINHPYNRRDYKKNLSDATINNYLRNIKVFFNWLYNEKEIRKNPVEKIEKLKAVRKAKETITEEEFRRLFKSFDLSVFHEYRNYIITKLLLDTGMRIGECLKIQVEDIDLKNKTILLKDTKAKQHRFVYLSLKMAEELRRFILYKDRYYKSNLLFHSTKSTEMTISSFEKQLKKAGERVGVSIHPHQIRNMFAKYYLLNNGDFFTLSKILGHSSITTTEQAYMDLTKEEIGKKYQKHSPLNNLKL